MKKIIRAVIVATFLTVLCLNAKPLPVPDVEPSLTAGAAKLPVIKWQETEVTITQEEPEVSVVADPVPEAPVEPQEEDYWEVQPDFDELDLLYRTVQAEGYTMGFDGMRLIADAILNLAEAHGTSVTDTILAPGQFTVISTGAIWEDPIYQDTIDAVLTELQGPREDYSIKYFRTGHYHGFGTPCFSFGNVYFSK